MVQTILKSILIKLVHKWKRKKYEKLSRFFIIREIRKKMSKNIPILPQQTLQVRFLPKEKIPQKKKFVPGTAFLSYFSFCFLGIRMVLRRLRILRFCVKSIKFPQN
uniref:Transmembrane protein n=1 Tax=Cacopsylla melanoneura TaxID=428564 RepID=A0A8D8XRG5_9HEMI